MGRLLWKWNIPGKANNSRYSRNDYQKQLHNSCFLPRFKSRGDTDLDSHIADDSLSILVYMLNFQQSS